MIEKPVECDCIERYGYDGAWIMLTELPCACQDHLCYRTWPSPDTVHYKKYHWRRDCAQEQYLKDLEAMAQKSGWISVEERLPAHDSKALVYHAESDEVLFGYYVSKEEPYRPLGWRIFRQGIDSSEAADVTHWMPLPEPPKE